MTEYKLSKKHYKLLKSIDFSDFTGAITFNDDSLSVSMDDEWALLRYISSEISLSGMDEDQNLCNAYGRKLYDLYDALMEVIDAETEDT